MINKFNRYSLLVLTGLLMWLTQTGCDKKEIYPSQLIPEIVSVSPGSGIPGTAVTIKGKNLKNVTTVRFGTFNADGFNAASSTDSTISVIVPEMDAADIYVQVYYSEGIGYSAAPFSVLLKPIVTGVDPATAFPGDEITISGMNLQITTGVLFGSVEATEFTAAQNSIVAKVPANAAGGDQIISIKTSTGGEASIPFNVNLAPQIYSFTPSEAQPGDEISVTGIRFSNTQSVVFGALNSNFTVVSDNELKFTIPEGGLSGNFTVTTDKGSATSPSAVTILVAGLALPIYDEAVSSYWTGAGGWIGGGWGGAADYANTEQVRNGNVSCKISYDGGWGSPMQLGGATLTIAPYSTFKISIFGGPGTSGKSINIGINAADAFTIALVEGEWTDYTIPVQDLTTADALNEIWIKEYNGEGGFTIWVDDMGLN